MEKIKLEEFLNDWGRYNQEGSTNKGLNDLQVKISKVFPTPSIGNLEPNCDIFGYDVDVENKNQLIEVIASQSYVQDRSAYTEDRYMQKKA